jgi:hypothetical protein
MRLLRALGCCVTKRLRSWAEMADAGCIHAVERRICRPAGGETRPNDPRSRSRDRETAALAARQHGVVAHRQLAALGLSPGAVRHRLDSGRLHRRHVGVYSVGHLAITTHGEWLAAVLAGLFLTLCREAALPPPADRIRDARFSSTATACCA